MRNKTVRLDESTWGRIELIRGYYESRDHVIARLLDLRELIEKARPFLEEQKHAIESRQQEVNRALPDM